MGERPGGGLGPPLAETRLDPVEPATTTVIESVAAVSNVRVGDLPSLYDAVETDALETIVSGPGTATVTFPYAGYVVRVRSRGSVSVHEQ